MRFFIIISTFLVSSVAMAGSDTSASQKQYCESVGGLAAIIMKYRRDEVTMSEVMRLDVGADAKKARGRISDCGL